MEVHNWPPKLEGTVTGSPTADLPNKEGTKMEVHHSCLPKTIEGHCMDVLLPQPNMQGYMVTSLKEVVKVHDKGRHHVEAG